MESQLFIPKRIKAGFCNREDTFSGRLSYISYFDNKGVFRKEVSWEGWRDKDIESEEFENTPQSGFVLHKDICRYNFGNFSSHRTLVRVFDPRGSKGLEFEILVDNLIHILMHNNCVKRELEGEFVYAMYGKELILLSTSSEEYKNAQTYTSLQSSKVKAKELTPGCSYKTKKQEDLVYLGKFDWYESNYRKHGGKRMGSKKYIFRNPSSTSDYYNFVTSSSLSFLAAKNGDDISADFASYMEELGASEELYDTKDIQIVTESCSREEQDKSNSSNVWGYSYLTYKEGGAAKKARFRKIELFKDSWYRDNYRGKVTLTPNETYYYEIDSEQTLDISSKQYLRSNDSYRFGSAYNSHITESELNSLDFCIVYATFPNGKKKKLDNFNLFRQTNKNRTN